MEKRKDVLFLYDAKRLDLNKTPRQLYLFRNAIILAVDTKMMEGGLI